MHDRVLEQVDAQQDQTTLVVVDMQPTGFLYAAWIKRPVLKRIDNAMAMGDGIVIVKYDIEHTGEIAEEIVQKVLGYPGAVNADKKTNDGSAEVLAACKLAGLPTSTFRVCGVTTEECVTETAHGLARALPSSRIEVLSDACYGWQGDRVDWSKFSHLPNVFVV